MIAWKEFFEDSTEDNLQCYNLYTNKLLTWNVTKSFRSFKSVHLPYPREDSANLIDYQCSDLQKVSKYARICIETGSGLLLHKYNVYEYVYRLNQ
jgi:hypothetical protein